MRNIILSPFYRCRNLLSSTRSFPLVAEPRSSRVGHKPGYLGLHSSVPFFLYARVSTAAPRICVKVKGDNPGKRADIYAHSDFFFFPLKKYVSLTPFLRSGSRQFPQGQCNPGLFPVGRASCSSLQPLSMVNLI